MQGFAGSRAPARGSRSFQRKSGLSPLGLVIIVAAHALFAYALMIAIVPAHHGAARKPLDVAIIDETKPPPPPPPRRIVTAPPKAVVPPPAYVPPPDQPLRTATAAPTITAVATPPAAPPPAIPAATSPREASIGVVCPTQVAPQMPQQAVDNGIGGVVRAQIHIRNGAIADIDILSGPHILYGAVRAAIRQYRCLSSADDVLVTQDFDFKVD
jgi:protein TonB